MAISRAVDISTPVRENYYTLFDVQFGGCDGAASCHEEPATALRKYNVYTRAALACGRLRMRYRPRHVGRHRRPSGGCAGQVREKVGKFTVAYYGANRQNVDHYRYQSILGLNIDRS